MTHKLKKSYVEDANKLKIQDTILDGSSDDLIDELDNALAIKKLINESWEEETSSESNDDESSLDEIIDEDKEKEYIQSLKSSIYSESFQKDLLKKVEQSIKFIKWGKNQYKEIILTMIENITWTIVKSNMEKNTDNVYVALRELLEWVIKEEQDVAMDILKTIQKVLVDNIEKIELVNKEKRELIRITLDAKNGNQEATWKVLEYMSKDIQRYARKITSFNSWSDSGDSALYDDLYQEGDIGVLRGIQKFSPKKSDNVREYMKFWINQSMLSFVTNKVHTIRLPAHVRQMYIKISRVVSELAWNNIDQTTKNIADNLWVNEEKVKTVMDRWAVGNVINMSELLKNFGKNEGWEVSLDDLPFMKDDTETSQLGHEEIRELQSTIKSILSKEEQVVIIYRFGLFWADQLLLKDLGEKLWKTEERVRQIENRALNMLSIKYFDKKYWKWFREILSSQRR